MFATIRRRVFDFAGIDEDRFGGDVGQRFRAGSLLGAAVLLRRLWSIALGVSLPCPQHRCRKQRGSHTELQNAAARRTHRCFPHVTAQT